MIIVFVTFPDILIAREISQMLVESRLVACANIFPAHESLYLWEGEMASESEVAALYKSTAEAFSAIEAVVKAAHPYDVPCVASWDIKQGHAAFLQWVDAEVKI